MLNYTYGTNGMKVPNDYLVNVWPTDIDNINNPEKDTKYQEYKKQVKQDVEKVRDKVDVLIVAMHWGVEYTHNPTEYEKDMASYLASLGVDLIIGTHPHVIQPVTWIDNTLVIYSLGNFLSAQYQNQSTCTNYKCTTGLMTSLKIEKDIKGKEKSIKITNVENELIYNYYNQSTWRGFKVIPFSNPEIKTYLPSYKSVYNTYKEVVQRLDSNMYVKETVE
jgi:2',3'-cyclic-nucleotide 2'-phosphodiesterase (5'-nucleotidase family)